MEDRVSLACNERRQTSVPSLDQAILVLECLRNAQEAISFTEIRRNSGLPKSTCHRILSSLCEHELVEQIESIGRYALGYRLALFGRAARYSSSLLRHALPIMREVASETGQTVKISVRQETTIYAIDKVESPRNLRVAMNVGGQFPIHAGAASKLLLAYAPVFLVEKVLSEPLARYTDRTITDPNVLRRQIEQIRYRGYAEDEEEYAEGIRAIACPVFDSSGDAIAALSIPYVATETNNERKPELIKVLARSAQNISEALERE